MHEKTPLTNFHFFNFFFSIINFLNCTSKSAVEFAVWPCIFCNFYSNMDHFNSKTSHKTAVREGNWAIYLSNPELTQMGP